MNTADQLGPLADPSNFTGPLHLGNTPTADLLKALRSMLLIRFAEEAVAELTLAGLAKCPCHLGIGQEAVAVGVSAALKATDRVYGGHRSHSHYLALGGSLEKMMAEILGKADGASKGMGGSMHLYAPEVGFHGSVPIVAATVPVAAGAALAAKMDGKGAVAVAYFGDGACEEGVVHETMNMAAVMALPLIFVCENNLYSSHLDIKLRQPADSVARYARAHHVEDRVVDGNDYIALRQATEELVSKARAGGGPAFIEAVTYRWRGHVGPDENIDVGLRRSASELAQWKRRDPVARLWQAMLESGRVQPGALPEIETELRALVAAATSFAKQSPYPPPGNLLDFVYAPQGQP